MVKSGWHVADRAIRLGSVQGSLQSFGVVGLAVAFGAMLAGVDARSRRECRRLGVLGPVSPCWCQACGAKETSGQGGMLYKAASREAGGFFKHGPNYQVC